MGKGNIGLSLRKAPKPVRTGKALTQALKPQSSIACNHHPGNRVIRLSDGVTGAVVETYRLTIAVQTDGITSPREIISGRYDDFQDIGGRFADHGPNAPERNIGRISEYGSYGPTQSRRPAGQPAPKTDKTPRRRTVTPFGQWATKLDKASKSDDE